jgi:hypothetical protein
MRRKAGWFRKHRLLSIQPLPVFCPFLPVKIIFITYSTRNKFLSSILLQLEIVLAKAEKVDKTTVATSPKNDI